MENLAGVENCDESIMEELTEAGIIRLNGVLSGGEVPFSVIGVLSHRKIKNNQESIKLSDLFKFVFRRAWYYWVVKGAVPMTVAKALYDDPIGKKYVRVAGHCGCPPPDQEKDGRLLWANPYQDPNGKDQYAVYVYHIDSQEGLNLFVSTLKKHGLV